MGTPSRDHRPARLPGRAGVGRRRRTAARGERVSLRRRQRVSIAASASERGAERARSRATSTVHHAITATVATATVLGGSLLIGMGQALAQRPPDNSLTVTVVNMTPSTPRYTSTPEPLTITLSLTNTTRTPMYDVT